MYQYDSVGNVVWLSWWERSWKQRQGGFWNFWRVGNPNFDSENKHTKTFIRKETSWDRLVLMSYWVVTCSPVVAIMFLSGKYWKNPQVWWGEEGVTLTPLFFLFSPPPPPEYAPKSGLFDRRLLRLYQLKCLSTSESMGWHFLHINSPLNHSFKS